MINPLQRKILRVFNTLNGRPIHIYDLARRVGAEPEYVKLQIKHLRRNNDASVRLIHKWVRPKKDAPARPGYYQMGGTAPDVAHWEHTFGRRELSGAVTMRAVDRKAVAALPEYESAKRQLQYPKPREIES